MGSIKQEPAKTGNMATFTIPTGTAIDRPASDFVRCRASFSWENQGHIGTTMFKPTFIVMEPIEQVGPALAIEAPGFTSLKGLKDRDLWFDAIKAEDAQAPRPHEGVNGVHAVVPVGGIRMRVIATVEEAQNVIDAARSAAGSGS